MKVGRNQPCPCGSGEKYKKCCLGEEKVSSDLLYRRLGKAHDMKSRKPIREQEGEKAEPGPDQDELMQIPKVREQIEKTLFAHWENWVDAKIPALGHITPRQAVKDPDGRESVEALLLDAERHEEMDAIVHELNQKISSEIDCTDCANCCKEVQLLLDQEDIFY